MGRGHTLAGGSGGCLPVADDFKNVYFTRQNTRNTAKHDGVTGNVLAALRIKIYR